MPNLTHERAKTMKQRTPRLKYTMVMLVKVGDQTICLETFKIPNSVAEDHEVSLFLAQNYRAKFVEKNPEYADNFFSYVVSELF